MPTTEDVQEWMAEVETVGKRIGPRFSRSELRRRATRYLQGLISRVERKNGWQLAEELGEPTPVNVQHFLGRADWDADEVRNDLRGYVSEQLGAADGILIVDETGCLVDGAESVGAGLPQAGKHFSRIQPADGHRQSRVFQAAAE